MPLAVLLASLVCTQRRRSARIDVGVGDVCPDAEERSSRCIGRWSSWAVASRAGLVRLRHVSGEGSGV